VDINEPEWIIEETLSVVGLPEITYLQRLVLSHDELRIDLEPFADSPSHWTCIGPKPFAVAGVLDSFELTAAWSAFTVLSADNSRLTCRIIGGIRPTLSVWRAPHLDMLQLRIDGPKVTFIAQLGGDVTIPILAAISAVANPTPTMRNFLWWFNTAGLGTDER
jgi:hypothetical protein